MSFLDAIACVISRTTHALDVITSISRYDRRSNLLHIFLIRYLHGTDRQGLCVCCIPVRLFNISLTSTNFVIAERTWQVARNFKMAVAVGCVFMAVHVLVLLLLLQETSSI